MGWNVEMSVRPYVRVACALALGALALPGLAQAQFTRGKSNQLPEAVQAAGAAMQQPAQQTQMTPDQIRSLMWLRALQSRGSGRGVRTGIPQFVPFGAMGANSGFGQVPQQTTQPKTDDPDAKKKTSAQKKAELRAEREEKQREAREKAKQKREAAAKARADKAKAARQPATP
jgi:hypothetical protein